MNEYLAGGLSGITQTIAGHPLDTLKVWQQDNIKRSITLKNLYRGVGYPLVSSSFLISLNYGLTMNFYQNNQSFILSGLYGGLITGFVTAPIEYLKVNSQATSSSSSNSFFLKNLKPENLKIKNLKLENLRPANRIGFSSTMAREAIGFPVYYQTYYYFKEKYQMSPLVAGGLSGLLSWTICYPIDTIKTRVQTGQSETYYQAYKFGKLWLGYRYCALRAIITNSIGWVAYEFSLNLFKK